ncbi:glucans biosynthesis glucosyltransferase MdoH [Maritimibacter dapengensis]|uniref:Glucans biosynthesis glucosyltransferase MdoH n=1 Tax=Maritimibacter dapengensis TaxID=2836868 RepID=A0ABS6SZS3_9RHOB|nr:glucans biosynthesis glucosyltransferase MdoH [Maritimibacter dapengensis]
MNNRSHIPPDRATVRVRALAIGFAAAAAIGATVLVADAGLQDGFQIWDAFRICLILLTTGWLAWGAALSLTGLWPVRGARNGTVKLSSSSTVVLVPICNEDPVATFARIAAMDGSIREAGLDLDIVILSDTRSVDGQAAEQAAFRMLIAETQGGGHIYYRNRTDNRGRKAGNVEDFIRTSGGAYDYAVTLDADSLVSGSALAHMIARMDEDPKLGLLQTLPKIIGARSFFGRAMQFSSSFHGPVFTRGLERMQGATGPYWGHNAIVRVSAFAQSCGLPELPGKAPFGGHILSHDYVEAALLARGGWRVTADATIGGSYEEGPENVLSYAKRDRRWCQGNLQHMRLLRAPGLAGWSRFVFVQGIFAYLVSLLWAAFLVTTVAGTVLAPEPDYFPDVYQLFPAFPSDRSREITALALGIVGLLIMPKFAILLKSAITRRARAFGGAVRALGSVVVEILLTSMLAPVMLLFQTRAVLQVLLGQDGGWPANARGEGALSVTEAARASGWIVLTGFVALGATAQLAPALLPWLLPVTLPMIGAPFLISWSSQPVGQSVFRVPEEIDLPPLVAAYREIHQRWKQGIRTARPVSSEPMEAARVPA